MFTCFTPSKGFKQRVGDVPHPMRAQRFRLSVFTWGGRETRKGVGEGLDSSRFEGRKTLVNLGRGSTRSAGSRVEARFSEVGDGKTLRGRFCHEARFILFLALFIPSIARCCEKRISHLPLSLSITAEEFHIRSNGGLRMVLKFSSVRMPTIKMRSRFWDYSDSTSSYQLMRVAVAHLRKLMNHFADNCLFGGVLKPFTFSEVKARGYFSSRKCTIFLYRLA